MTIKCQNETEKLVIIKMRYCLLEKPLSNERFVHAMMNVQSL